MSKFFQTKLLLLPTSIVASILFVLTAKVSAHSGHGESSSPPSATTPNQSLFDKYGGAPTITKVVDDAVVALIADCKQNPYFTTVLNTPGHDTTDRLKSCLDLFFTSALGGPATYPGPSHFRNAPPEGYPCQNMVSIHAGLGIPNDVFDGFIVDLGKVLKTNGVTDADVNTIATQLETLRVEMVAAPGTEKIYNYTPNNPPGNGCTNVPSPVPSSSPASTS
jgi:hypothetical protein